MKDTSANTASSLLDYRGSARRQVLLMEVKYHIINNNLIWINCFCMCVCVCVTDENVASKSLIELVYILNNFVLHDLIPVIKSACVFRLYLLF